MSAATQRTNHPLVAKPTLAQVMRDKALAAAALERIALHGGPAGLIARDALERMRGGR